MSTRYITVDRQTPMLLPCDLRDWVPDDDMVHFVIAAVEGLKLEGFRVNSRGSGSEQYPPHMMLSLLIYCYCNGLFSSRRIERATHRDVAVRYLTGDTHPDHDTIAKFRRENFEAVHACFLRVLEQAREIGVLKVGAVSVDGTKLRANASKHQSITYERAGELLEQLDVEIKELLAQAESADRAEAEDGQRMPEEIARREALREKLRQARERIEQRTQVRIQAERTEYERQVEAREHRKGKKGRRPQPPEQNPRADEQINMVDADSNLMRRSIRHTYEQSYNAQAAVDADGSQLVLGTTVARVGTDQPHLVPTIEAIPERVGKPAVVLADAGYADGKSVDHLQRKGVEVYVAIGAEATHHRRRHDFRPEHRRSENPGPVKAPWRIQMREKLRSETGRTLYARRKHTVEPVFGIIKHVMGFRQFLLRGLDKVKGEWALITLAYNFKRLWSLQKDLAPVLAGA